MHDQATVSDIVLRPAKRADAGALAELGERAFNAKFAHLYVPEDLSSFLAKAHAPDPVAAEIANPDMRICLAERALESGERVLVGFCKLVMACGWPEYARGTSAIELKQLYLDPDLVGGGIGKVLMEWALAEARGFGADEMQLSVWSGNDGAQRFYARYGCEKVADIKFWVGNQCDEEFLFARML
jgi:ribosomal protein S18 acetylase RimI-like enzyme